MSVAGAMHRCTTLKTNLNPVADGRVLTMKFQGRLNMFLMWMGIGPKYCVRTAAATWVMYLKVKD